MVKKIIIILVISLLSSCSSGNIKDGFEYKKEVKPTQALRLGDVNKSQWELELFKDTFADKVNLTMNVLPNSEMEQLSNEDFKLLTAPLEINLENQTNVRLQTSGKVTLKLPSDYQGKYENLFFGYFVNDRWEYFTPDLIDLDKGLITFEVNHFTTYGLGELSESEQISNYANKIASQKWLELNDKSSLLEATKNQYNQLFENMGVSNTSDRNQFTADVISFLEESLIDSSGVSPIDALAQMSNAASQGEAGKQAFIEKYIEFTGKALMATLERDPEAYGKLFSSSVALSKIALALKDGDDEEALKGVGSLLKIAVPQTQIIESTLLFVVEKAKNTINYWTDQQLEEAYQAYIGNGGEKYGFTDSRDFDLIFTTLGGGQRMSDIRIINKWCEDRKIKPDALGQASKDAIIKDAYTALKANFDLRKVKEPEIQKLKLNEEAFILAMKNEGLLDPTQYKKFFKIDSIYNPTQRLKHLYELKASILNMLDPEVVKKLSPEQLAIILRQWVTFNEMKDRKAFYDYLRDSNYLKAVKMNAAFAWVLVDTVTYDGHVQIDATNAGDAYTAEGSAEPGAYSYTWSYRGDTDTYYNPPLIHGEGASIQANFSAPPATIQGEELVTLTISIAITSNNLSFFDAAGGASADIDKWDTDAGYTTNAYPDFENKDGKSYFKVDTYKTVLIFTNGDTVTAIMPNGLNEGDKIAIRTSFSAGAIMGTNYVYEWKATR